MSELKGVVLLFSTLNLGVVQYTVKSAIYTHEFEFVAQGNLNPNVSPPHWFFQDFPEHSDDFTHT